MPQLALAVVGAAAGSAIGSALGIAATSTFLGATASGWGAMAAANVGGFALIPFDSKATDDDPQHRA